MGSHPNGECSCQVKKSTTAAVVEREVVWKLAKARPIARHIDFQGLDISIETDKGQLRHWTDEATGETGTTKMQIPYGYIKRTVGADKQHIDVFVGPETESDKVFVVHQMRKPDFKDYDEDKVLVGFASAREAKAAYLEHFNSPKFFGSMDETNIADFKRKYLSTQRGWIGVDLDGTLAEYDRYRGAEIGKPIPAMVERVKREIANGVDVRIFTARAAKNDPKVIENIKDWCKEHIGKVLPITNAKDPDMIEIWDDRAKQVVANTGEFVVSADSAKKAFDTIDPSLYTGIASQGMQIIPPAIDPETLEGVKALLNRMGSVKDPELMQISETIFGAGYDYQGKSPQVARNELVGWLLDQRDLLSALGEQPGQQMPPELVTPPSNPPSPTSTSSAPSSNESSPSNPSPEGGSQGVDFDPNALIDLLTRDTSKKNAQTPVSGNTA